MVWGELDLGLMHELLSVSTRLYADLEGLKAARRLGPPEGRWTGHRLRKKAKTAWAA